MIHPEITVKLKKFPFPKHYKIIPQAILNSKLKHH